MVEIASEDYDDLFQTMIDSLHETRITDWAKMRDALVHDLVAEGVSPKDANTAVKAAACYFMDFKDYCKWDIVDYVGNLLFDVV
jgi:hypothetical protein